MPIPGAVSKAELRVGPIDVLVNNAELDSCNPSGCKPQGNHLAAMRGSKKSRKVSAIRSDSRARARASAICAELRKGFAAPFDPELLYPAAQGAGIEF
jgi:hypothetical protein